MIFPPQCKKGGTVLLTALSSPLTGGQSIADIAAGVEGLGFRVQVGETCQASTARGYAAAPPEQTALGAGERLDTLAAPAAQVLGGGVVDVGIIFDDQNMGHKEASLDV